MLRIAITGWSVHDQPKSTINAMTGYVLQPNPERWCLLGRFKHRILYVAALALALGLIASRVGAEELAQYSGAELYQRFCASCHGTDGRGNGPVSASLKVEVPDLTRLTKRQGAAFPAMSVRRIIDGQSIRAAHGARRMPVWGYEFAAATQVGPSAAAVQQAEALIDRLVDYLRSIQESSAPSK